MTRREFSMLLPENEDFSTYSGFVNIENYQFPLKIEMKTPPLLANANISIGKELESFLGVNGVNLLISRFKNAKILDNFLMELKDLLVRIIFNNLYYKK